MQPIFPLPDVQHGNRILLSVVEQLAEEEPAGVWASIPIDVNDVSKGYKDLTFSQLNNAACRAALWLRDHLPESPQPFQSFAYVGPSDIRYAAFAIAAGKLKKVMIVPSPVVTIAALLRIFEAKGCDVYFRAASHAESVDEVVRVAKATITSSTVPELGDLFQDTSVVDPDAFKYTEHPDLAMNDPWLVFHTSGTTGDPRPVTYTHKMMALPDISASVPHSEESPIHHFALKRWYISVPLQHYVGLLLNLAMTSFLRMIAVCGPPGPPSSEKTIQILKAGSVSGALLTPSLIDNSLQTREGLATLRRLKYIHYAGAPLSRKSGHQLASHVSLHPAIGSTEAGGYLLKTTQVNDDWDYVAFQEYAWASFEPRFDDLHELVFVRRAGPILPQVFQMYPKSTRFETKDLWIEHPTEKGFWKIVGRVDDYVCFSHGHGLYAAKLEPEIENHEKIRSALIGGHGLSGPILLLELVDEVQGSAESENSRLSFLESLQPYLDKANAHCHPSIQLSLERTVLASSTKPFVRTLKGSVARLPTLTLYEHAMNNCDRHLTQRGPAPNNL